MNRLKLALLCDYGLDDAIATLFILRQSQFVEKVDILPIAGNMFLKTAQVNARRLVKAADTDIPVQLVDTSCIPQNGMNLTFIHGNDGMGDVLPVDCPDLPMKDFHKWLKDLPEDEIILSLGPATVAEKILEAVGDRTLYAMGGNLREPPNQENYEFNHFMDKKAFADMVRRPHLIATLDTCNRPLLDFERYRPVGDTLFDGLIMRYNELCRSRGDGCYIYDLVACNAVLHPELFTAEFDTDPDGNCLHVLKFIGENPLYTYWK